MDSSHQFVLSHAATRFSSCTVGTRSDEWDGITLA